MQQLKLFPGPYAMLAAYVDEAGTTKEEPALCVAGILYDADSVGELDAAWKVELDQVEISHFHATDYAHLRGEFDKFREQENGREVADGLYRRLIELVVKHVKGSMCIFCMKDKRFNPFYLRKWGLEPYTACAYSCIETLVKVANKLGHEKIVVSIESGQKTGELIRLMEKRRDMDGWPGVETCKFNEKKLRPLQTADILAYEYSKRIKDHDFRKVRKSLRKLIPEGLEREQYNQIAFLNNMALEQIYRLNSSEKPKRPKS